MPPWGRLDLCPTHFAVLPENEACKYSDPGYGHKLIALLEVCPAQFYLLRVGVLLISAH